jgi:hypothetical protein
MATKLHQIIALANGKKAQTASTLTELHHILQKTALLAGITKTFRPIDADAPASERLPSESQRVQVRVSECIDRAKKSLTEMIDMVATQDIANTQAFADVAVDGKIIIKHIPATHLLFLEKRIEDLLTFVNKLPVLDPAESWSHNAEMDCMATPPSETVKTKKVPAKLVKYEATKEHPAQVDVWMEDVPVGFWSTIKFSGAIPDADRRAMLARLRKLQDAVQTARGEANSIEVKDVKVADDFLGYIFGN